MGCKNARLGKIPPGGGSAPYPSSQAPRGGVPLTSQVPKKRCGLQECSPSQVSGFFQFHAQKKEKRRGVVVAWPFCSSLPSLPSLAPIQVSSRRQRGRKAGGGARPKPSPSAPFHSPPSPPRPHGPKSKDRNPSPKGGGALALKGSQERGGGLSLSSSYDSVHDH